MLKLQETEAIRGGRENGRNFESDTGNTDTDIK
jgi:hypothetical protein